MINRKLFLVCLMLAAVILISTGLVPHWGEWYSDHLPLRWQTESMLQGRLAISSNPADIGWDLAWGAGGVQQLWGLGVPLWRLPFELIARCFGLSAFPDRLAFGVALTIFIYGMSQIHGFVLKKMNLDEHSVINAIGFAPLVLFPPFIALCSTRFLAYEEVVAYSFMVGAVIILVTVWFSNAPSTKKWLLLSLIAGLAPFIRPTLVFYSLASLSISTIIYWRSFRRFAGIGAGLLVFFVCVCLLLLTNKLRFDAPMEFGHSLSYNSIDAMRFASRFGSLYEKVALPIATRELLSLLFFTKTPPDIYVGYDQHKVFIGQANTFRWREIYFSTYDFSYAVMFAVVCIISIRRFSHVSAVYGVSIGRIMLPGISVVIIATSLLVAFYVRCPFISSRYFLDFAPGFACVAWVFWLFVFQSASRISPSNRAAISMKVVLILFLMWWAYEVVSIKAPAGAEPLSEKELILQMDRSKARVV